MSSSTSSFSSHKLNSPSNLQNFLRTVTPFVRSKPILQMNDLNTQIGKPITEYFTMGDLWMCYEQPSVYGIGTPVILDNGELISQYYTPYLSALQLYTNKSSANPKDESVVVDFETESWSDDSDSEKLSRSLSNNSSKGWDSNSVDSSVTDVHESLWTVKDRIGDLYYQYFDNGSPYWRTPLMEKIGTLCQKHPGIMSLKSTDLSPASWMAVAWYPIYPIPNKDYTKDLLACFLTFHLLSSSFQETPVVNDEEEWTSKLLGDTLQSAEALRERKKKGPSSSSSRICLPPFGLASYRVNGDVWINEGSGDMERLKELHSAANSWLKQLNVHHHDFNFFTVHSAMESDFSF